MEEIVAFLGLKVFIADHAYSFFCSRNAQVSFVQNLHLKYNNKGTDVKWALSYIHILNYKVSYIYSKMGICQIFISSRGIYS